MSSKSKTMRYSIFTFQLQQNLKAMTATSNPPSEIGNLYTSTSTSQFLNHIRSYYCLNLCFNLCNSGLHCTLQLENFKFIQWSSLLLMELMLASEIMMGYVRWLILIINYCLFRFQLTNLYFQASKKETCIHLYAV